MNGDRANNRMQYKIKTSISEEFCYY